MVTSINDYCNRAYFACSEGSNDTYIPYIVHDTQYSIYMWSHAIANLEKSRSLESVSDAKTGEQSVFGEIHTNYIFGMP